MKFKPMLFNADMVNAIIKGSKTQTRREVKLNKKIANPKIGYSPFCGKNKFAARGIHESGEYGESHFKYPFNKGDIIWVRETFQKYTSESQGTIYSYKADNPIAYNSKIWKPSIHMPKEACRLFLEVTNVKIERLQDISENDARKEGIETIDDYWGSEGTRNYLWGEEYGFKHGYFFCDGEYWMGRHVKDHNGIVASFFSLWSSIYGVQNLKANPYVFVIEFKKIDKPENFI